MILSKKNPKFKKLKKLALKKYRDLYQEFLVFGEHLVEEALKSGVVLELYTTNTDQHEGVLMEDYLMRELNKNKVLYSQVAVCQMKKNVLQSDKILVLDDVQDPGNVGTLLRSASAFGFKHVFFSDKSVDFYNEKVIAATQGALFNLFLERGDTVSFLNNLKKDNTYIFSSSVNEKTIDLKELNQEFLQNKKRALVVGHEGSGISQEVKDFSSYFINIDTSSVESLNVNVAGSILMYLLK
ncbi:MAG: RNA methyltransferase [Candidatus Phytoplasma pruni]|uniref:RNA methyltransferase n=1 Tax=Milkweed yellows phytoplasma TaxID=208434 RepID=UPI00037A7631|nr:RNA methyltransferase [Milkweed yellows phytoplasma]